MGAHADGKESASSEFYHNVVTRKIDIIIMPSFSSKTYTRVRCYIVWFYVSRILVSSTRAIPKFLEWLYKSVFEMAYSNQGCEKRVNLYSATGGHKYTQFQT